MTSVAIQRLRNEFNVLTSELLEKAKSLPKDSPEYIALEGRIAKLQVTLLQTELERLKNLVGIASPADPEALNKMLWTVVGLKLAKFESNQDLTANQLRKYRGGMRVTDVREGSNAATNKFQKGDILVGLDKWETTSFENIKFVFDQPEVQAVRSLKFYILRGSETLYGVIQWNNDEPSIGQLLLNQLTKPAEAKSPNSDDAN